MIIQHHHPTIDSVKLDTNSNNIFVDILRIDKIHPQISGNKWFKLKYNLLKAKKDGHNTLLTFGGAFSNHVYATAVAAKEAKFKSIGIIRGEETLPLNPTLKYASFMGMQLCYVSRAEYRKKHTLKFINKLKKQFGNFYLVPEGGTNQVAIKGVKEILTDKLVYKYDYILSAVGTGGTLAGLICKADNNAKVIGISSLKGHFLTSAIKKILKLVDKESLSNWEINSNYHFGGYAKYTKELVVFINDFKNKNGIPLDPIYTGKMMYGIIDMVINQKFTPNSKVLAIHTGGLQGVDGFNNRFGKLIY